MVAPQYPGAFIERGTPEFRRTNLALFSAGFSTFALLYCVQPLLPVFSREFGVSAAESSLSLSLTTGLLAASVLIAGALSEAWGRKSVMIVSLFAAAILTSVKSKGDLARARFHVDAAGSHCASLVSDREPFTTCVTLSRSITKNSPQV